MMCFVQDTSVLFSSEICFHTYRYSIQIYQSLINTIVVTCTQIFNTQQLIYSVICVAIRKKTILLYLSKLCSEIVKCSNYYFLFFFNFQRFNLANFIINL